MTQRILDVENAEDMKLLWSILPDEVYKIKKEEHNCFNALMYFSNGQTIRPYLKINWHDKREITRPIQEATEQDIGKLCCFWNDKSEEFFGRLGHIGDKYFTMIAPVYEDLQFLHCRRLTITEIEELC